MDNVYPLGSLGGETGAADDALAPDPVTIDVAPSTFEPAPSSPVASVTALARSELAKAYAEAQAAAELAEFYRRRARIYAGGALVVGFLAGWLLTE
jgi:hypothetical protein